jgi:hypothetical protein
MHDFDLRNVNAENFVSDLSECCLESLPMRLDADAQFEATIGRQPCEVPWAACSQ